MRGAYVKLQGSSAVKASSGAAGAIPYLASRGAAVATCSGVPMDAASTSSTSYYSASVSSDRSESQDVEFYDLDVNARATAALNTAIVAARSMLAEAAERGGVLADHFRYLASWLEPLDESHSSLAQRDTARRLCLSVRLFCEACHVFNKGKCFPRLLVDSLHGKTVWAAHPPMTSSRAELLAAKQAEQVAETLAAKHHTHLTWKVVRRSDVSGDSLDAIADQLLQVAARMCRLVSAHPLSFHGEDHLRSSGGPALCGDAARSLGEACAAARSRFAELGAELGVGQRGEETRAQLWRRGGATHLFSLVVLAIEAAEYLVEHQPARDALVELRHVCMGLRLFSGAVENATRSTKGALQVTLKAARELRMATNWAAHAPTHAKFAPDGKWASQVPSRASLDSALEAFQAVCGGLYLHLELLRFVDEGAAGTLPPASSPCISADAWRTWGWQLWVALELKDVDKRADDARPRFAGPFYAKDVTHHTPFLVAAFQLINNAVAAGSTSTPDNERLFLLRAQLKACREIEYAASKDSPEAPLAARLATELRRGAAGFSGDAIKNGSSLLPQLRALAHPRFSCSLLVGDRLQLV